MAEFHLEVIDETLTRDECVKAHSLLRMNPYLSQIDLLQAFLVRKSEHRDEARISFDQLSLGTGDEDADRDAIEQIAIARFRAPALQPHGGVAHFAFDGASEPWQVAL